jgi:hypothetical protein
MYSFVYLLDDCRKEWEKCEGVKRDQFLGQLMVFMRTRMSSSTTTTTIRYLVIILP